MPLGKDPIVDYSQRGQTRRGLSIGCPTDLPSGYFYANLPRGFAIAASPAGAMRALPGPWRLDHAWLRQWLTQDSDPSLTPFVGLQRLLPGQTLVRDTYGSVEVRDTTGSRVWGRSDLDGSVARTAYIKAFEVALDRLLSASPVISCELSGGLDSTFAVASLARRLRGSGVTITAYCLITDSAAPLAATERLTSDLHLARLLVDLYPDVIRLETVPPRWSGSPLSQSRSLSRSALWPSYGQSTLSGFAEIRRRASKRGSNFVWTSVHGNASFSHDAPSLLSRKLDKTRAMRDRFVKRSPSRFMLRQKSRRISESRKQYLRWLAGHTDLNAVVMAASIYPIHRRDPYRAPEVLEVAARMTAEAWRRPGMNRGFARAMGCGIVPDAIRLNPQRGVQGADVWFGMFGHERDYADGVELLLETTILNDVVDALEVRRTVASWPWGQPAPSPPLGELAVVNRILALAHFIADAQEWLGTIASRSQRADL